MLLFRSNCGGETIVIFLEKNPKAKTKKLPPLLKMRDGAKSHASLLLNLAIVHGKDPTLIFCGVYVQKAQ
jgi:hypothetical protein